MRKVLRCVAVALAILVVAGPAVAQNQPRIIFRKLGPAAAQNQPRIIFRKLGPDNVRPPELQQQLPIQPSDAAAIAQAQYPGSRVVKVKRRGEIYAVTLRTDSSVVRVLVDGYSGDTN